MRLFAGGKTFDIVVEFDSCLDETLVDVGEHGAEGVEGRVEEHGMRLDLEGTVQEISSRNQR